MNIDEFIKQYYREFIPYKAKRWCYEDGILLKATLDLYNATNDDFYKNFILGYLDRFIDDDGVPLGYKKEEYSTDDVQSAFVLEFALNLTHKDKYQKAIDLFYKQLEEQPRCLCGNFFHKGRYPYQVWMDGLYMAQPFLVIEGLKRNNQAVLLDTLNQFKNVRKYLFDEKRHLYVHAYDEKRVMQWSNKLDGKSENSWSRACGWYLMALVDIIEILGVNSEISKELTKIYKEAIDGLIPYLDKEYTMLYQVIDAPNDKENYLETSGSSMMSYSLLKAYRLKIVDEGYGLLGDIMFNNITKKYLVKDTNGHYELNGICQVAGLDNEKRNGSKAYYYSEKICANEVKGVAPYFMAYSEILREKK